MRGLQKKVVLISGGLGDIGISIANRLQEEGCTVVLGDIREKDQVLLNSHFPGGVIPQYLRLDVTDAESWSDAFSEVVALHGRCDVLVNNAGVISKDSVPFSEISYDEWKRLFSINVDGTFLGTQAALRTMGKGEHWGAVINIGSIAGFVGSVAGGAYGSSKGTIESMTKQAALSAAKSGRKVRVNAVHPGYVWTLLVSARLIKQFGSQERAIEAVRQMNPMNQVVGVDDVAATVAFLASEDAKMINGAGIVIDGGRLLQ